MWPPCIYWWLPRLHPTDPSSSPTCLQRDNLYQKFSSSSSLQGALIACPQLSEFGYRNTDYYQTCKTCITFPKARQLVGVSSVTYSSHADKRSTTIFHPTLVQALLSLSCIQVHCSLRSVAAFSLMFLGLRTSTLQHIRHAVFACTQSQYQQSLKSSG